MRLLNVDTFEIVEFNGSSIPPYIAISHTWDDQELTFADWHKIGRRTRPGYAKVKNAARVAKERGAKFIWMDTCCIDKSSSAELSEAINSMFKWYAAATACYVYMSDVPTPNVRMLNLDGEEELSSSFSHSRWFKRGWTLQELLAHGEVKFFTRNWVYIDQKARISRQLSKITGIDVDALLDPHEISNFSVAKRMSWASDRDTTRTEDLAYCLLGIFDVNMPLLYGEGEKAFIRLQEQIMRETNDQSLFAWVDSDAYHDTPHGMLATHPSFFRGSGVYRVLNEIPAPEQYTMTNRGLSISLRIEPCDNVPGHFLAPLDCATGDMHDRFAAILLRPVSVTEPIYCRVQASEIGSCGGADELKKIIVRQNPFQKSSFDNLSTISIQGLHHNKIKSVELMRTAVPNALKDVVCPPPYMPSLFEPESPFGECQTEFGLLRRHGSVATVLEIRIDNNDTIFLSLGRYKDGGLGFHTSSTQDWLDVPSQLDFTPCNETFVFSKKYRGMVSYTHCQNQYADYAHRYLVDIHFADIDELPEEIDRPLMVIKRKRR